MSAGTTKHRVVEVAMVAFADRGVAGTSLDDLARQVGMTKQAILYHFGSKDGLVGAVLEQGARDLIEVLAAAGAAAPAGWDRVEATVRAAFGLAVRRPELVGLLRELGRLGPERTGQVVSLLQPMIDAAVGALQSGMDDGRLRRSDPRLVLVSAYAIITGVVADTGVLRAVGLELNLKLAVDLRRAVLAFLRAALLPE
ncbi:MAG: TetR family transcriptional regulator [Acidimicrobiia bacterium]|nr:TetR family transcriptional regulator [Acidimicrobiia bacterium]